MWNESYESFTIVMYYMQFEKFYIPLTKGILKFRGERGGPKQCNFRVGGGL